MRTYSSVGDDAESQALTGEMQGIKKPNTASRGFVRTIVVGTTAVALALAATAGIGLGWKAATGTEKLAEQPAAGSLDVSQKEAGVPGDVDCIPAVGEYKSPDGDCLVCEASQEGCAADHIQTCSSELGFKACMEPKDGYHLATPFDIVKPCSHQNGCISDVTDKCAACDPHVMACTSVPEGLFLYEDCVHSCPPIENAKAAIKPFCELTGDQTPGPVKDTPCVLPFSRIDDGECSTGYYLQKGGDACGDTCKKCKKAEKGCAEHSDMCAVTAVDHGAPVHELLACVEASPGYYLAPDKLAYECTPVLNSIDGSVTCTTASNSRASCLPEFYHISGTDVTPDECAACEPQANCEESIEACSLDMDIYKKDSCLTAEQGFYLENEPDHLFMQCDGAAAQAIPITSLVTCIHGFMDANPEDPQVKFLATLSDEDALKLIVEADKDKDGSINLGEFAQVAFNVFQASRGLPIKSIGEANFNDVEECMAVPDSIAGTLKCTSGAGSQATCIATHYNIRERAIATYQGHDKCLPCTEQLEGCFTHGTDCTPLVTETVTVCDAAEDGYYIGEGEIATTCPVPNLCATVTCSGPSDITAVTAVPGSYIGSIDDEDASKCFACKDQEHCITHKDDVCVGSPGKLDLKKCTEWEPGFYEEEDTGIIKPCSVDPDVPGVASSTCTGPGQAGLQSVVCFNKKDKQGLFCPPCDVAHAESYEDVQGCQVSTCGSGYVVDGEFVGNSCIDPDECVNTDLPTCPSNPEIDQCATTFMDALSGKVTNPVQVIYDAFLETAPPPPKSNGRAHCDNHGDHCGRIR
jgi:hypothetical protein